MEVEAKKRAPAAHTLRASSEPPEMIFVPSGEKPTEQMTPLCALCFSAFGDNATPRGEDTQLDGSRLQDRRKMLVLVLYQREHVITFGITDFASR